MQNKAPPTVPAVVTSFLDTIERDHGITIEVREQLTMGKSGAFVAIVDCSGELDGIHVLKVDAIVDNRVGEEARHKEAINNGAFSGKIPKIILSLKAESNYCMLINLAGRSRIAWRPLIADHGLFRSAYAEFSKIAWTPKLFELGKQQSAREMIVTILGHKLLEKTGGRIDKNVSTFISTEILAAPMFMFHGQVFPNPVFFAKSDCEKPQLRPLLGPTHGDCHSQNLFVLAGEDAGVHDVNLIDFATYQAISPLFFDHAYLELATLLRKLDGLGLVRWHKLVEGLATENRAAVLEPSERGWLEDILEARKTAKQLTIAEYPNRQDDLQQQMLLARVSAGLAFLHKVPREGSGSGGLTHSQYGQSFLWSAVFLKQLLSLLKIDLADIFPDGTAIQWPSELAQTPRLDEQASDLFPRFEGSSFNILIIGSGLETLPSEIASTPWTFIIDFRTTPPEEGEQEANPRLPRQLWPGQPNPDLKILHRGSIWYFANGRSDISDASPSTSTAEWRRRFKHSLDDILRKIAEVQAPNDVRCLALTDGMSEDIVRMVIETIDIAFQGRLAPVVVASVDREPLNIDGVELRQFPLNTIVNAVIGERAATPSNSGEGQLPRRGKEGLSLEAIPDSILSRVSRDLTVLYRVRGHSLPDGRSFGVDFRRGMPIEWAELAQNLDVPRQAAFDSLYRKIEEGIEASSNRTVNLLHEPSAGGTTLGRRLAWSFMERVPTVIVDQISSDTSSYLREIFQFSALPLLVLLESSIVTESEREGLLQQLREDNTRAVFLWISRAANKQGPEKILSGELSNDEAQKFLAAYLDQVSDPSRQNQLRKLAEPHLSNELRSPFFFGLTAFGEGFFGVDKLIDGVLAGTQSKVSRELLADLTLVSLYSSEGFPANEFDELCDTLNGGKAPVEDGSLFLLHTGTHIRVSHAVLARRVLAKLARKDEQWRADLPLFSQTLLSHLSNLHSRTADRVQNLVQALFITRDFESTIQADVDVSVGGIPNQRRFSLLLNDLGNAEVARQVFVRITQIWPREPHYSAHLARHLMYEDPRDFDQAVKQAKFATTMPDGENDAALNHVLGMAHRLRMEQFLKEAASEGRALSETEPTVLADYEMAVEQFDRATELKPSNEHGLVATIQTVSRLLQHSIKLSGMDNLAAFLRSPSRDPYMQALAHAEEHIDLLRNRPRTSIRAEKTIAEWNTVYGNTERVVSDLRALAARHEDIGIRRALCAAIVARSKHNWRSMAQSDLRTVALMMEKNINQQGVQDADIRRWFSAYRQLNDFDESVAIQRLLDWHGLNPKSVEPVYYLYALNFMRWLSSPGSREALAGEINRWIGICQNNRPYGNRSWSYDWLEKVETKSKLAHFKNDLDFDPPSLIKMDRPEDLAKLEARLSRVEGTLRGYRGPQFATLDLGFNLFAKITPLERLSKDDEGKRISAFLSFSYDGLIGWNPRLVRR
jgi:tetratricopeptide (TPR) repeat protein